MDNIAINIFWKSFSDLSPAELYAILQLRARIFIVEQNCAYLDLDNTDLKAQHLLAYTSEPEKLIGTARIYNSQNETLVHFGRLCIDNSLRGKSYGALLMNAILEKIKIHHSQKPISISAQYYLKSFYESFNFVASGNVYDEDGIPHIHMGRD